MAVSYQHEVIIRRTPTEVFAVIDDLPQTAKWLPPCVSLTKVGDGPNAEGDTLRYVYRQGKTSSEMTGRILTRQQDARLHCLYSDAMFDVSVDLQVAADPQGCLSTHSIAMTPKTLFGRLLQPLIRLGLGRQTRDAAANLKSLLESTA
jgi:uncharacterized protein YndB with AHSA1/START domain